MSGSQDPFVPSPELAAIARRWLVAHASRDVTATLGLFSQSAALTFVGSDEGEFVTGADVHDTFADYFDDGVKLEAQDIEVIAYEAGSFGWAFTTLTVHAPDSNMFMKFRNTLVFSLENAVWRVVHAHNSNPKPNIESMGYDAPDLDKLIEASRGKIDAGRTGIASVMFTDIVDSTALAAATGDSRWSRIVTDHVGDITRSVEASDGKLVKSLGDGTLSTFGSASAALHAAQAIMRAAAAQTDEPHLRLRIGIHTGDVVEAQGDYLGTVVNKAARVAAAASPDEIRISDATRAMVSAGDFSFVDPITVPLKGLDGEHVLYSLAWQA
ncbi:adenylate/guanylate cyclase domain-containing protein [Tateyamaria armeniaca]|uniref:Adenylate/guanylate cyclase domain-containing protein n=1 Tax=Tateyamaria armeniaca TaxID=2518930 RepID=A0ABW8V3U8_9RHOB